LKDPNRLRFTPNGRHVLISDTQGGDLVVMDAAGRKEVGRVNLSSNAVAVQPDGSKAYAALPDDDAVAVIDLETFEVLSRIPTGAGSAPGCIVWVGP
jgi:YVTN family beta-propeller protein